MEKVKKIAKYATNILAIVAALVSGINAVEGITIPYAIQIVQIIAVVQGVIGTYLFSMCSLKKNRLRKQKQIYISNNQPKRILKSLLRFIQIEVLKLKLYP